MIAWARRLAHRVVNDRVLTPLGIGRPVDATVWQRFYGAGRGAEFESPDEVTRYGTVAAYAGRFARGGAILDVGCGSGHLVAHLRPFGYAWYVGIDYSAAAIAAASALEDHATRFAVANFEEWPVGRAFDVLVFNESLAYARSPVRTLRRFAVHLSEAGVIVVSNFRTGNHRALWRQFDPWFTTVHSTTVRRASKVWDIRILRVRETAGAAARAAPPATPHAPLRRGAAPGAAAFDLPILMYHDIAAAPPEGKPAVYQISMAALERQLDLLATRGYRVIGFPELFRMLDGSDERTGREVVLTFDDGYESFATRAVPALVARGMSATVFIVAGEIGGRNRWDDAHPVAPRRRLMDDEAIRGVVAAGMHIGSHGWAHRDLTRSSSGEVATEVARSRQVLCERYGVEVDVFSYPFGVHAPEHYDALKSAGYRGAVTIFSPERRVTSNPFAMRRVYVHAGDDDLRFRMKLAAPYLRYRSLREGRSR